MLVSSATNSVTKNSTTSRCARRPAITRTAAALLLDPHVGRGMAGGEAGERLAAARSLTLHAVDVVRRAHRPERVVRPDVPDLLAETAVQVLVDALALIGVGGRAPLGQQAVDLRVVDPAEVRRVGRLPPDILLVGVAPGMVAPADGLEVAGDRRVDLGRLVDRHDLHLHAGRLHLLLDHLRRGHCGLGLGGRVRERERLAGLVLVLAGALARVRMSRPMMELYSSKSNAEATASRALMLSNGGFDELSIT